MKIICIEGNYKSNKENFQHPVFSIKSENCLLRNKNPFFIPEHSELISIRVHLVIKISRLGKNIQEKFAHLYYDEIGIGIDMIATDTLEMCRKKGLPWEPAKAYDSSSPLGSFISISSISDTENIPFSMKVNNQIITESNSSDMLFSLTSKTSKSVENIGKTIV